ncbi:hypothetical protein SARC_08051 [Sphaeroforma arctica JP610]|uniref:J domain-containing protein n=1 Tax=Sphaeroforma arctica JP610 TaxID=667725 RepID=A0A0L0FSJ2_9EUKA|nr:hypothetical protein, variant [Sphaeroforma arctica JP610]XP_014153454.1 hypothetical protein SARC_08051 [Sphaeroforma arctica JP610]KNC79551.1 hypothetical protein, variant [Sphaeroforma arctica JP610]KNC79552.1 hypothetical protein SARC_08051 [Sphaeroforma arctica JP610]|eukprot:XP_014153453.1 hypothetical protein, variant [Sphaeroforma arctica JP610]
MRTRASRNGVKNVRSALAAFNITDTDTFDRCDSLEDEFKLVKKAYFKTVLRSHPDKGGDAAVFRDVQASFELVREMYEKGRVRKSFSNYLGVETKRKPAARKARTTTESTDEAFEDDETEAYDDMYREFADMPTPSWEFYAQAAEEVVPPYRMETAKTGRSKCNAKGKAKHCTIPFIPIDEVRVGVMDAVSGSYGRWVHLHCWRVPGRVWLGLPDHGVCKDPAKFATAVLSMNEVLLQGLDELPEDCKREFCEYIMVQDNWAALTKANKARQAAAQAKAEMGSGGEIEDKPRTIGSAEADSSASTGDIDGSVDEGMALSTQDQKEADEDSRAVARVGNKEKQYFVAPRPGKDGAIDNILAGKTVVVTGLFPELGGGTGLNLGKEKMKKLITDFGGRVTSSLSGKTDILVVGKEPGFSKVTKARKMTNVKMVRLPDLKDMIEGGDLDDVPDVKIENFSGGYWGNSLALEASRSDWEIAAGTREVPKELMTEPYDVRMAKAKAATGGAVKEEEGATKQSKAKPKAKVKAEPQSTRKRKATSQSTTKRKAAPKRTANAKAKTGPKRKGKGKAADSESGSELESEPETDFVSSSEDDYYEEPESANKGKSSYKKEEIDESAEDHTDSDDVDDDDYVPAKKPKGNKRARRKR